MIKQLMEARDKEEGFTLIELLVVVIIIGILAAIAIPVFLNQRESAAKSSLTTDARNGAVEIETYFTSNQTYPANQAAVEALPIALSESNAVGGFTNAGSSFTYCVEATGGAANGWSVTYDSATGGVADPVEAACA